MAPIITSEKVRIYLRYGGEMDDYARGGKRAERAILSDTEWTIIDDLMGRIYSMTRNKVSPEYVNSTMKVLEANWDNESTIELMLKKFMQVEGFRKKPLWSWKPK